MALHKLLQPGTWFAVGCRRRASGWLGAAMGAFAFLVALYVVFAAVWIIIDPWELSAIFLMSMMALAFLSVGARPDSNPDKPSVIDWILAAASLAAGTYFALTADALENRISLMFPLDDWQLLFGTITFFLTLEITRRTTGMGLTVVVLTFVAYNFFGHHLDGVLSHGYISYTHFLDIMVFTTDGVMGLPVRVAATYAFMFVLFGTILYYAKGGDFFFDFAAALSGRSAGGPAKIAVVSSGMYGMISGSPTSDVVTTGSITIPIMKRLGYQGSVAGAIEVAASTGGSLMPPVMGSAAFIMAEYTGIDYAVIAVAALLPALLYYVGVFSQVHFRSIRRGFGGLDAAEIPGLVTTLKKGGLFIIPLAVLVYALIIGYTPTMVAVYGAVAVIYVTAIYHARAFLKAHPRTGWFALAPGVVQVATHMMDLSPQEELAAVLAATIAVATLYAETRVGLFVLYKALAETSIRMVPVAGATAAAGLVIAGITMTGLAAKFAHVVYAITDAQVFYTLIVAAALTIVLGMGMPTPSAYILAAVLIGPLMNQLQIDPLPGHMFLLYFAVMSALTPPVAVAAYAAASIAEANPLAIAGHASRFALAAFVVPFTFVYGPELLWQGPLWQTALTFCTAALGLIFVSAALESYRPICAAAPARALMAVAGLCMITPFIKATLAGLTMAALAYGVNRAMMRRAEGAGG
jgi:TRAP transporter 4TM/12TM fusion protein